MKQPVFGAKCVFLLEFTLAQYMILTVLVKILKFSPGKAHQSDQCSGQWSRRCSPAHCFVITADGFSTIGKPHHPHGESVRPG